MSVWLVEAYTKPWTPRARTISIHRALIEAGDAEEAIAAAAGPARRRFFWHDDYEQISAQPASFPLSLPSRTIPKSKVPKT